VQILSQIEVGPDEFLAAASAEAALSGAVASVQRFTTSNRHYVYDVKLTDGRSAVVRIGLPGQRDALEAAARWSDRLRPLGIPLPEVLARDLTSEFPFIILERLRGTDLRRVIHKLSLPAQGHIAGMVATVQALVANLPSEGRFGFAMDAGLAPYIRWSDVLAQSLVQSRAAIRRAGLMDEAAADAVERRFARYAKRLDGIASTPFLPDTAVRNVIVSEGGLFAGIVDIDRLCWGDPRYASARAAMTLLNMGCRPPMPKPGWRCRAARRMPDSGSTSRSAASPSWRISVRRAAATRSPSPRRIATGWRRFWSGYSRVSIARLYNNRQARYNAAGEPGAGLARFQSLSR
jgi:aminoglycoside phosphotransferase (APT) family kinase protein